MAHHPGIWCRWRERSLLLWRQSFRPWLCRRNFPYFVLIALVAFLVTTTLSGRPRHPEPFTTPAGASTAANVTDSAIRLGQSPVEVRAAWEDLVASQIAKTQVEAETAMALTPNPSAFSPPCRGKVLLGRGWRREESPGTWIYHRGLDLLVGEDQPIVAIARGKVLRIEADEEGGTLVEIEHGQGWRSIYARLGKVVVHTGADVPGGGIIGWVAADQVHFELWRGKSVLDPLTVFPGLG